MFDCLKRTMLIAGVFAVSTLSGCGGSGDQPDLGSVSGVVTLDGKPVVGVNVVFKPDVGRAAAGNTNAEGKFTLQYLDGVDGCKLGPNTVGFDWPPGAANTVSIPTKYNDSAAFKFDIKTGANTCDLTMESDGSQGVSSGEQESIRKSRRSKGAEN